MSPDPVVDTVQPAPAGATPANFDEWLAGADEPTKTMISHRFTALENTVRATRDERDAFKVQIKDLLPKAEKGSDLEKSLNEITGKLDAAEKRAAFAEEATRPEVNCSNPKAAYLVAVADGHFDKKGNPDWAAIKAAAPELFRTPSANAAAGAGTQQQVSSSPHAAINNFIRGRGNGV